MSGHSSTTPTPAGSDDTAEALKILHTVKPEPNTTPGSAGDAVTLVGEGEEDEENMVTKIDEVILYVQPCIYMYMYYDILLSC